MIRPRSSSLPALALFFPTASLGLTERGSLADKPHRPLICKLPLRHCTLSADDGMLRESPRTRR
jgi:hypothetical protein